MGGGSRDAGGQAHSDLPVWCCPWQAAHRFDLPLTRSSAEPPPRYSMIIHSFVLWDQRSACQHVYGRKQEAPRPHDTHPGAPRGPSHKGLQQPPTSLPITPTAAALQTGQVLKLATKSTVPTNLQKPGWENSCPARTRPRHLQTRWPYAAPSRRWAPGSSCRARSHSATIQAS